MSSNSNKNSHRLTLRQEREIARQNRKMMRLLEEKKRRAVPVSEYTARMRNENNIVEIEDLHTVFFTDTGVLKAVDGVTFDIPIGSTVSVVGESGCGKSVTALSLIQLVQAPQGQIVKGSIRFKTQDKCYDITKIPTETMRKIRGRDISMIFQEPMTSLNPVFTVGAQLDEVLILHFGQRKKQAAEKSVELLKTVGIARAEEIYKSYPHQLSGGMRQRVVIAMALACNPKLIIADEPTTALDVTVQAQILELLRDIKAKMNASILLITHDLGVVAETADYVVVMYAGRVVEKGTVKEIFSDPRHPYTIGLMRSKPEVGKESERLLCIPGQVPNPIDLPDCCYFRERCDKSFERCGGAYPESFRLSDTHYAACYLADKGMKV